MSNLLEVTVAASSATVVVNFASWWFVWKHERGAQDQSSRDLKDQLFWIGFSYLLPLLPAIIAVLGPGGGEIFSEKAVYGTFGFVTVLAILFGVLMTGLSISNYGWIKRDRERASRQGETIESRLPDGAKKHLYWTSILTLFTAIAWWYLVFA